MNHDEILQVLKKKLSNDRYEHTIRVYETAIKLAYTYGESIDKVTKAALFHDYAKCLSENELKYYIESFKLPQQLLQFNKELWHGPVGAMIVKEKYQVLDQDVFNAIYYHTTGREKMSKLELIIFVADYIEPGRSFPGLDEVRDLANNNLQVAARKVLQNTIIFLMKKDATIYPDTFLAYNELTNNMKEW